MTYGSAEVMSKWRCPEDVAYDRERVLAEIDTITMDDGLGGLGHGVLLVWAPPSFTDGGHRPAANKGGFNSIKAFV